MSMLDDLNYPYSIEELYPGESGLMIRKASFSSIFLMISKLVFHALKQLNPFSKKNIFPKNIETVVIICSLNQHRALQNLLEVIPNVLVISDFPVKSENNIIVNNRGNCWLSLLYMPKLVINLIKQKGFKYRSMLYHFDHYLNAPGVYSNALKQLNEIKPKSLLVANDHVFFTRSYFRAAEKLGVKTIYTQHASVSDLFPPLEYDYAFLDGDETLDKYTSNGKTYLSDIFLSGSPRFDKIPLTSEINIYELGIAINVLDNKDRVLNFVKMLSANNINFIMRPHPGQPDIDFWRQYCEENDIGYSNSLKESPIIFIASAKCFVVGDSGLHLEVALCKKISFYVNFQNNEASDCYDYVKEGLVDIKCEKDIIDIFRNKKTEQVSVDKVKYYVANFETEYWGKSTSLIAKTIKEINEGKSFSKWQPRSGKKKIFEIKQ